MALLTALTSLQPRTKTYMVAGLLVAFAASGFLETTSTPFALVSAVSGALVLIATSLVFRWPFARIAALVPLALTAALSLFVVAYNTIMLFVFAPPTLEQSGGFVLSVVIGLATVLSARWLESVQAKAYFSRIPP